MNRQKQPTEANSLRTPRANEEAGQDRRVARESEVDHPVWKARVNRDALMEIRRIRK